MSDKDFQYALMLQRQFEQETRPVPKEVPGDLQMAKLLQEEYEREQARQFDLKAIDLTSPRSDPKDAQVALQLQAQFETESSLENPTNSLYYTDKKNKNKDSVKSLIDPSWELVDPTPNVHILFMAFSERYFWNKLQTVSVAWSKRMTTCAGICSYQGRGGMCSITLSEPLLKLRPRKDLVETLLHEMIHAFLFVTHNYRDRDGHGPEFHKHMYRINGEAGTNITVYHDFHDEVKLYQQYWWRCNGPCQTRKPYFGMVRRAMNRAPGPNDRWWAEHSRTCGGEFIKVKEPEKAEKKPTKKTTQKAGKTVSTGQGSLIPFLTQKNVPPATSTSESAKTKSNIVGFGDLTNQQNTNTSSSNKNQTNNTKDVKSNGNIVGFKDLGRKGSTAVRSNSSSTVIVNPKVTKNPTKSVTNTEATQSSVNNNPVQVFGGEGRTISNGGAPSSSSSNSYNAVRNHWLNKFSNTGTNSKQGNKRPIETDPITSLPDKKPKLATEINLTQGDILATCPICSKKIPERQVNEHIDVCLSANDPTPEVCDLTSEDCVMCGEKIRKTEMETHLSNCLSKSFEDDYDVDDVVEEEVACLVCNQKVLKKDLSGHLDDCMNDVFDDKKSEDSPAINTTKVDASCKDANPSKYHTSKDFNEGDKFNCPVCMAKILQSEMNAHLDQCLTF